MKQRKEEGMADGDSHQSEEARSVVTDSEALDSGSALEPTVSREQARVEE
jgi:hypothetical protein